METHDGAKTRRRKASSSKATGKTNGKKHNRYEKRKLTDLPKYYRPGYLKELDGRHSLAKFLRQICDEIINDMGGPSEISRVKLVLIERFAFVHARLKALELQMFEDEEFSDDVFGKWIHAVNALNGLAAKIGLSRKGKYVDVRDYINKKTEGQS
ncbi:hypothetical protein [Crateriforma conspicua]|uniref:hypothetical protein n=1 Tax=Crateriforma conspicua TaxID=2527996 RepID=UPI00118D2AA7|nr:hypothetical protein [Crateriforma conspicua]QDV63046.1 hypothetical protein Mal65_21850 [Crateriforma conspicua]